MSTVELLQSFSLPGEICRKFALDWSQDNKIAVCTSKAIYIMTSYCSPVESFFPSPLHKQVIKSPEKVMQLQPINIPSNPYNLIQSLEDEVNIHNILMDHTLNPTPLERAEAFKGFRCAKWSPKGAAKAGRCILATLTMDHRLNLYEEINNDWVSICDLTEVLKAESEDVKQASQLSDKMNKSSGKKKKVKTRESKMRTRNRAKHNTESEEEEEDDDDDDYEDDDYVIDTADIFNYEAMKERTYKLAPVEITWTSMLGSPASSMNDSSYEYCYLIVAMKSGHIHFWKITSNESRVISLAHEWDSGLGLITAICWQQTTPTAGFLLCGTLKGRIAFLSVDLDTDQEPVVTVKQMCRDVWDEDFVSVDHFAVLKIALKKYVIVAAKQHALVGCVVLYLDQFYIENVGHSFGLHNLPVTGMSVLDSTMPQSRLLISTMDGLLIEIKISLKGDEIKFQHEKLSVDLDFKNMMVQGLAVSSNGIICSVVLSTVTYFDHLEKKEPLQFAMFLTQSLDEIYGKLKNVLKPTFSFSPSNSNNINRHLDFFECIRISLAYGHPLPQWMTAFLDSDLTNFENASELELYTMRFLLYSYVSGLASSVVKDKPEHESKLSTVESLLMKKYVSKIFGNCQDKIDLLTPAQGQSLLLMADWLFKEFRMQVETAYSALGCDPPVDPDSLPARETCRICKGEVRLEGIRWGQCAAGHRFARCCQTLLLCDITAYLRCRSCKSVALPNVWSLSASCTFCGLTMV